MDRAQILWIRFCPQPGAPAEIMRVRPRDGRLHVESTLSVPLAPWEEFEAAVEAAIRAETAAGGCRCVVDLAHCKWFNSQGVGGLIAWYQMAVRGGGKLVLARPNARVRNVLAVTRLDQVFPVRETLEEAVDEVAPVA